MSRKQRDLRSPSHRHYLNEAMEPKTKRQKEVIRLSASLPPATDKQTEWAYTHCFCKEAYQCKGKAWCSECGGTFETLNSDLAVVLLSGEIVVKCPHCGTRLTVKPSRKKKIEEQVYFTVVTTCRGYQVCRNYIVSKFLRKGDKPYYDIHEVVQNWIAPDGHEEIVARVVRPMYCCYDNWNYSSPMEIRRRADARRPDKYIVDGAIIYPERRLLPMVKRNGYTSRNNRGIAESEHIRLLLTDHEAEWLEKSGQYALFGLKYRRGFLSHPHSVKVANRVGYKVKDADMWIDYLHLLDYFKLDTHNAYYVCPKDLKKAHDVLEKRRRHKEAQKAAEHRRREALKNENQYKADKGQYFGISFGDGNITVSVIQSVIDMIAEGEAMHHCVGSYFNRKDSLILSARDTEGNRIETVEVSLQTYDVVQSRAACNGVSPQHDDIIKLVRNNMHLIRQAS